MKNRGFIFVGLALIAVFSLFLFFTCSNNNSASMPTQSRQNAGFEQEQSFAKRGISSHAITVQNRHTKRLMEKSGIVGTATGITENGQSVILVFAKSKEDSISIPENLEDVPVVVEVTGVIYAYKTAPAASTVSFKAKQTPPIKLGCSGGWASDMANGYCCGGTLGSLISDGTKKYILSNYHVFQADIVAGGNNSVALAGDLVIQPGLIDVGCNKGSAQAVAALSELSFPASLPNSNVDASIAEIVDGMVSPTGEILGIGNISSQTIPAAFNQKVKKSGRTSGLTRSYITGLNATISVQYENECAGEVVFTKTFTNQIVIRNKASGFLKAGDSGSLMVEDKSVSPKAVGLLFAGSSTVAIANPINEVLGHFSQLGASFFMVGN
jgi:hypothetical protein